MTHSGGRESESENWLYVTHCVREIFSLLYEIRRRGHHFPKDPVEQTWMTLLTREETNRILSIGIDNCLMVTNVLHVHVKQNAVMRCEYESTIKFLKAECLKAVAAAEKATKVASSALSKSNSK